MRDYDPVWMELCEARVAAQARMDSHAALIAYERPNSLD